MFRKDFHLKILKYFKGVELLYNSKHLFKM